MREAEHQGNPAPCSNDIIWLDFDPNTGESEHRQGIKVFDEDTFQSLLIIQQGETFAVSTIFWLGGTLAQAWKYSYCKFTISYFAQSITGLVENVPLGVAVIETKNFTGNALFPCPGPPPFNSPYLIYGETVTQVIVAPDTLAPGAYRLTALASFTKQDCDCPLPFNAYVTGPVLEVAETVEHN